MFKNSNLKKVLVIMLCVLMLATQASAWGWFTKPIPPQVFNKNTNLSLGNLVIENDLTVNNQICLNGECLFNWTNLSVNLNLSSYLKIDGSNADRNIDINGYNFSTGTLFADYFHLNTSICTDTDSMIEGLLCWDPDQKTLNIVRGNGQIIQVGKEMGDDGINKAGEYLMDGTIVSLSNFQGDNPTFIKADGTNVSKSDLVGVLTTECDIDELCPVTVFGFVNHLDTSGWTTGTKLYIDPLNPGKFSSTVPTLPNNPVWVASVGRVSSTVGTLFVFPKIDPGDGFLINQVWATSDIRAETFTLNGDTISDWNQAGTDNQNLAEVLSQGNSAEGESIYNIDNFNMTGVFRQGEDGNMFIYDINNELHHLNVDLERFDELRANTFTTELTIETFCNASGSYINISAPRRIAFIANYLNQAISESFDENEYILELYEGTNETPVLNRIYAYINVGEPTWVVSTTEPTIPHAMAARVLVGDGVCKPYASALQEDGDNGFLKRVQRRFRKEGLLYESGLDYNATATYLEVGSGQYINGIYDSTIENAINSSDGFYLIYNNGSFAWLNSFEDITEYSSGETIGTNKYFNVVFGVTPYDGQGNIYAVVQSKPSTEYTSTLTAYSDNDNTLKVYPSQDFLKVMFLPVARMVLNEGNNANLLPNGMYAEDYRGGIAGGASSGGGLTESDPVWTADKPDYVSYEDNTANLNMTGYNITDINSIKSNNNLDISFEGNFSTKNSDGYGWEHSTINWSGATFPLLTGKSSSSSDIGFLKQGLYLLELGDIAGAASSYLYFADLNATHFTYLGMDFANDRMNFKKGVGPATKLDINSWSEIELGSPTVFTSTATVKGTNGLRVEDLLGGIEYGSLTAGFIGGPFNIKSLNGVDINIDSASGIVDFNYNDIETGGDITVDDITARLGIIRDIIFTQDGFTYGEIGISGLSYDMELESNSGKDLYLTSDDEMFVNADDEITISNAADDINIVSTEALRLSGGAGDIYISGPSINLNSDTYMQGELHMNNNDISSASDVQGATANFTNKINGYSQYNSYNLLVNHNNNNQSDIRQATASFKGALGSAWGGFASVLGLETTNGFSSYIMAFSDEDEVIGHYMDKDYGGQGGFYAFGGSKVDPYVMYGLQGNLKFGDSTITYDYTLDTTTKMEVIESNSSRSFMSFKTSEGDSSPGIIDNNKSLSGFNKIALGSNTLKGLSNGDINASTIYYDTLVAKSPVFQCSQNANWCSVIVPEYQKTLFLEYNPTTWEIVNLSLDNIYYTPNVFYQTVCKSNAKTQDVCDQIKEKVVKLQAKKLKDIQDELDEQERQVITEEEKQALLDLRDSCIVQGKILLRNLTCAYESEDLQHIIKQEAYKTIIDLRDSCQEQNKTFLNNFSCVDYSENIEPFNYSSFDDNDTVITRLMKFNVTYDDAVELYEEELVEMVNTTCTYLGEDLKEITSSCKKEINTGIFVNKYRFKDRCGWDSVNGYQCVREVTI